MDLSQYSDEDLMSIAKQSNSHDMSSYSDNDLMRIAGMSTPEPKPFSFARLGKQVVLNAVQGVADIGRFGESVETKFGGLGLGKKTTPIISTEESLGFPFETDEKLELPEIRGERLQEYLDKVPKPLEGSSGIIEDAVSGMARFLPSMGVSAINPVAGTAMTFAQIAGMSYDDYIKQGVDPDKAFTVATINSLAQTPLEMAGNLLQIKALKNVAKSLGKSAKLGTRLQRFVGALLTGAVGEGGEEFLQQFPDEIAQIYLANPDLSPKEIASEVFKQSGKIAKRGLEAAKVGAVGGMLLAGGVQTIAAPFDIASYVSDKQREINDKKGGVKKTEKPSFYDELSSGLKKRVESGEIDKGFIPEFLEKQKANLPKGDSRIADIDRVIKEFGVEPEKKVKEPEGRIYEAQKKRQEALSKEFEQYQAEVAKAEQENADQTRFDQLRMSSEDRQKAIESEFKYEIETGRQEERIRAELSARKKRDAERILEAELRKIGNGEKYAESTGTPTEAQSEQVSEKEEVAPEAGGFAEGGERPVRLRGPEKERVGSEQIEPEKPKTEPELKPIEPPSKEEKPTEIAPGEAVEGKKEEIPEKPEKPKSKERPNIGKTGKEIYQNWKKLSEGKQPPQATIVGFVPGEGIFSFRNGKIVREFGGKKEPSTYRPATNNEIDIIHDAISKGQFQVEQRKIKGALGLYTAEDAGSTQKVLHQATGKPVPESVLKDYPELKKETGLSKVEKKPTPTPEKTEVAPEGEGIKEKPSEKAPETTVQEVLEKEPEKAVGIAKWWDEHGIEDRKKFLSGTIYSDQSDYMSQINWKDLSDNNKKTLLKEKIPEKPQTKEEMIGAIDQFFGEKKLTPEKRKKLEKQLKDLESAIEKGWFKGGKKGADLEAAQNRIAEIKKIIGIEDKTILKENGVLFKTDPKDLSSIMPPENWTIKETEKPLTKPEESVKLKPKEKIDIGPPENINPIALSQIFLDEIKKGTRGLNKIRLRKIVADHLDMKPSELQRTDGFKFKPIEEAFEYAIVKRAKEIIKTGTDRESIYNQLKSLYESQPSLSTRTSTSIENQAYSTPVHLGYIIQEFAGINRDSWVYEPTAGTGMLLTESEPATTWANELDRDRLDILQNQGFLLSNLNGENAIRDKQNYPRPKSYDAVVANPPFGSIDKKDIKGFKISKLEHAIMMDALDGMKDNGKAAFIIGGQNFENGKMNGTQRTFLNWLHHHYNVVANIDIPGNAYARQGSSFPIRVIVVRGRKIRVEGWAPKNESAYQKVESIDEILTLLKEVEDGKNLMAPRGIDEVGITEEGTRPPGAKESQGKRGELSGTPQDQAVRPSEGITGQAEGTGKPAEVGTAADGTEPGGPSQRTPLEGRPSKSEQSSGAISGISEGEIKPEQAETVPESGESGTKGVKEPVKEGAGRPITKGVSGTGGIESTIDDLLKLSDKEAEKARIKQKREEGLAQIASGIKKFNDLLGEEGELKAGEEVDPEKWPQLKAALQEIWEGFKKVAESIKEAAELFIKDAYSKLSTRGKPYINKFINEEIRKDLETEANKYKHEIQEVYDHDTFKQFKIDGTIYADKILQEQGYDTETLKKGDIITFKKPVFKQMADIPKAEQAKKPEGDQFQVTYEPKSKGPIIDDTLMPRKMFEAVNKALDAVETEVGDIDEYVRKKLQYRSNDELYNALSADQIDATALAINNIDNGMGMIIGDQTGVGKGRVAAAIFKYAQIKGLKPIFFTEKPNLFSDFYRDIVDIGHNFNPFIMASNAKLANILDQDGKTVFITPKSAERRRILRNLSNSGISALGNKDGILTTYSQVNKRNNPQQQAIANISTNNMMIMDESHNASGQSNTGLYLRGILADVDGVVYLSATFAKRPDTMPVYYKTAMSRANLSMDQLINAINAGGTALQEIVSNNLARLGQYIRREKSFNGIDVISKVDSKNRVRDERRADQMTEILRDIIEFDSLVSGLLDSIQAGINSGEIEDVHGIGVDGAEIVNERRVTASVDRTNFTAVVHNAVRQLLLSMNADMAVETTLSELKEGRKPIIAVSNTMESFVKDQIENGFLSDGEAFNMAFPDVLERHLRRTLQFRVRQPNGDTVRGEIPVSALPPQYKEMYDRVVDKISKAMKDLPGSPIDYIKQKIAKAGYIIEEITGRTWVADLSDPDNPTLRARTGSEKAMRNQIVNGYNNGGIDALIVNSAAATGLSAHSSPKFKDQRPRAYIGVQAELNIDTEVQKMGRINRKGQVNLPKYISIYIDIPTEIRPASVLMDKLKSLSANTSANADSPLAQREFPDMMNKYGDRVVRDWITESPTMMRALGFASPDDATFIRTSGRMALMPTEVQRHFFESVEDAYNSSIEDAKQDGTYDLEVEDIDFKARTISKELMTSGTDESNPFGESTWREELSVVMPKKPFTMDKIKKVVSEKLGNKKTGEFVAGFLSDLEEEAQAYLNGKKGGMSEELFQSLEDQTRATLNRIHSILDDASLGKGYNLWRIPNINNMKGVLIDIKLEKGRGNPAAPSRTKLIFAVDNALQKYSIPLSKLDEFKGYGHGISYSEMWRGDFSNWDRDLTKDIRETRYMITGNLLQGSADSTSGSRIIRFTMENGEIREGILLPMNYNPNRENTEVRITPEEAEKLIKDEQPLSGSVVSIWPVNWARDLYQMAVPKSRQRGGPYFLDEKIRSLTDTGDFESVGNEMRASIPKRTIGKVINRVYEIGDTFNVSRSIYNSNFENKGRLEQESSVIDDIRNSLGNERGSSQLATDIYNYAFDLIESGINKFTDFTRSMRKRFSNIWEKIKRHIKNLFNIINNQRGEIKLERRSDLDQWAKDLLKKHNIQPVERTDNFGVSSIGNNIDATRKVYEPYFDKFMYWMVDKNRPIQSVQKRLANVREEIDLFLSETQRPKVTASKIKKVWDDNIKPFIEKMAQYNINLADFEEYAHAKHASERNEAMRKANSKRYLESMIMSLSNNDAKNLSEEMKEYLFPDEFYDLLNRSFDKYGAEESVAKLKEKWDAFSERPSGMSDEEAQTIINHYRDNHKIESLRLMLSDLNQAKMEILRDSGVIANEEYENIVNKYRFYVPLYREGFEDATPGTGRGLQPAGRPIKTAMGSTRNVVNIVANSVANLESAINRAEKAESAKTLYNLIQENPDPDLWTLKKVKKAPTHDNAGNIKMYPDMFSVAPNEIRIMIDGEQHLIEVNRNNQDLMYMLRTLKAEDNQSGPLVNVLSKANRWLSRVNTSWSPEFVISNFVRDIQTAGINIQNTEVESKNVFKGTAKAIKAIYNVETENKQGSELEDLYDRFKIAGGKIGWADVHGGIEKLSKKISAEIDYASGKRPIRKNLRDFRDYIENCNTAVENGVRLNVFKMAIDQGMSDRKAAQIASDITVDFTKKGAAGPIVNSLYLFANAGIQGSYRILRAAFTGPKSRRRKVQKILGGIAGAGFIVGLLNASLGGKDDDGEDYYNKIDDYVRERNLIIMLPGTKGKYAKIPLPWGYNAVWNVGTEVSRVFTKDNYKPLEGASRLASTFADAFNPIQSGTLIQTLAPTIADPFVMVAENKTWFGGYLMPKEDKYDRTPSPDSQRFFKSVSEPSKWVANKLNNWTGGNKIKPGAIDISPETLDLIADTLGGSMLRFFRDSAGTPYKLIKNEEIEWHTIPFLRRIAGQKTKWSDSRIYFENSNQILMAKEELKAYKGTDQYNAIKENIPQIIKLIPFTDSTEKSLRKLRKLRKKYEARGDSKEVDRTNERINEVYIKYNKKFREQNIRD